MADDGLRALLERAYKQHIQALGTRERRAVLASMLLGEEDAERMRGDFEGMVQWLLEITPPLAQAPFVAVSQPQANLAGYYNVWAFPSSPAVFYVFLHTFVRLRGRWRLVRAFGREPMQHLALDPGEDVRAKAAALVASAPYLQPQWPEWVAQAAQARPAAPERTATTLFEAAAAGSLGDVEALLDAGADPERADREGRTPLHRAAAAGHRDVVERLLAAGADVNARDEADRRTPLQCAVASGHAETVELLLAKGADPDGRVVAGDTPLHLAVGRGRLDLVERLLAGGASVYSMDRKGRTPLEAVPWDAATDDPARERLEAIAHLLSDRNARRQLRERWRGKG